MHFLIDKAFTGILGQDHGCKIKALRSGLLLIEVDQKRQADQLLATKKLASIDVTIEPHKTLNTSKGVVFCDKLANMSDDEVLIELQEKNPDVKEVYRVKNKRQGNEVSTNLFILTFGTPVLPTEVKIGYLIEKVKMYIPNPRRCFNCQRYGHGHGTCNHPQVCAKCGVEGHEFRNCNETPKCFHCHQNHDTSDKTCPKWILEKKAMEIKSKENVTYFEAKKRVLFNHPELKNKLPEEQDKNQQKSWSNVVASSVPAEVSNTMATQQHVQMMEVLKNIMESMKLLSQQIAALSTSTINPNLLPVNENILPNIPVIQKRPIKRNKPVSSEEEDQPSKLRVTSDRQEDLSQPELESPPNQAETPSDSGKSITEEGMEEGEWNMAGRSRSPKSTRSSRTAPLAAPSSKPPPKDLKGGGKAGSSRPSGDRGSAVSKPGKSSQPPKKIYPPAK